MAMRPRRRWTMTLEVRFAAPRDRAREAGLWVRIAYGRRAHGLDGFLCGASSNRRSEGDDRGISGITADLGRLGDGLCDGRRRQTKPTQGSRLVLQGGPCAGDVDAMFTLGLMYSDGIGIPRNRPAASALLARAAGLGHAYAAAILLIIGDEPQALPGCMLASNTAADEEIDAPDLEDGAGGDAISGPLRDVLAVLSANERRVADLVVRIAPSYEIDPRLALALIATESNFEPLAHSVKDARGVMQLTPGTAARFKVGDPWNVQDNVRGGLTYLRWLLAYYEGQVALATAAYNAGEGAVDRYRGIPPYPETRAYVRRVQRLFAGERHPYDPFLALPSPILARLNPAP